MSGSEDGFNRTEFLDHLNNRVNRWVGLLGEDTAEEVVYALDYNYSPWPYVEDREANRQAFTEVSVQPNYALYMCVYT